MEFLENDIDLATDFVFVFDEKDITVPVEETREEKLLREGSLLCRHEDFQRLINAAREAYDERKIIAARGGPYPEPPKDPGLDPQMLIDCVHCLEKETLENRMAKTPAVARENYLHIDKWIDENVGLLQKDFVICKAMNSINTDGSSLNQKKQKKPNALRSKPPQKLPVILPSCERDSPQTDRKVPSSPTHDPELQDSDEEEPDDGPSGKDSDRERDDSIDVNPSSELSKEVREKNNPPGFGGDIEAIKSYLLSTAAEKRFLFLFGKQHEESEDEQLRVFRQIRSDILKTYDE